jgi:hypothetical protein
MLVRIGAALIALWVVGSLALHITLGLIHVLLLVGLALIVMHFLRGKKAAV